MSEEYVTIDKTNKKITVSGFYNKDKKILDKFFTMDWNNRTYSYTDMEGKNIVYDEKRLSMNSNKSFLLSRTSIIFKTVTCLKMAWYNHQTNTDCEVFMESKNLSSVMLMEKYQVENILEGKRIYGKIWTLPFQWRMPGYWQNRKMKSLKEEQRVELGESIRLPKIILCFCDSNYIDQNNFIIYVILCYDTH